MVRIMTYNICSGRNFNDGETIDISAAGSVIGKYSPDIVGLNEVRGTSKDNPLFTAQAQTLAGMLGYYFYFAPAIDFDWGGPYGNALLSRYPIRSAETILIADPPIQDEDAYYETRCILKAKVELPNSGELTVLVSHYGLANSEQRNAVQKTVELIKGETSRYLFMGDLNMQPDDEKLASLFPLMQDTAQFSREPLLSFPSDAPDRKIDYIFTSPGIRVLSAQVPAETVSDHRPYVAEVEV